MNVNFANFKTDGLSAARMRRALWCLPVGLFLMSTQALIAGDGNIEDDTGKIEFATPPPELRTDGTGMNVGIYGGATAFQNGSATLTSPLAPGSTLDASQNSELGGVGGIRLGYTWPDFCDDWPDWLMPALDADVFWAGYQYSSSTSTSPFSGSTLSANVNSYSLMLEPKIKFRLGVFRPYVGFGLGGTYMHVDGGHVDVPHENINTNIPKSLDAGAFSVEGLAGLECFIDAHWAFIFEYKYQYIDLQGSVHATVNGVPVRYDVDGLGSHLFTGGLSYYF